MAGQRSCNGWPAELQTVATGAAKVRRRSCNGATPELQSYGIGAASSGRSFNGMPLELQWCATGAATLRRWSCKRRLELRAVNVAVDGATSMLQACRQDPWWCCKLADLDAASVLSAVGVLPAVLQGPDVA
jgi:hypothetical protein